MVQNTKLHGTFKFKQVIHVPSAMHFICTNLLYNVHLVNSTEVILFSNTREVTLFHTTKTYVCLIIFFYLMFSEINKFIKKTFIKISLLK